MSALHDLNNLAQIELYPIFFYIINSLIKILFTSDLYLLYLALTTCNDQLQRDIY